MAPRTDDLIVALAADAAPVQRLAPVPVRLARWLGASAAVTAAGTLLIGVRPDIGDAIRAPAYAADLGLSAATAGLAAALAFTLSVPGAERSPRQRAWPFAAAALATGAILWRLVREGGAWPALAAEPWHPACGLRILLLAAIPAVLGFAMIRRAAPLEPGWTAALASLAALALGAVGAQLACPLDSDAHLLVAHAAPLAVLTMLGTVTGGPALRR